jgi:tetratricopeptide (TPR) repeat protein
MASRGQRARKPEATDLPDTPDAVDVAMSMAGNEHVARTLLEKHSRLIDAQIQSEHLEHGVKRALIAFRILICLAALVIVGGFAWMVAKARQDHALVIEAMTVPPDLAARGLTGEALAATLSDKLGDIDRRAQSFRSPETLSVNWGDDVKIEIPSTGVSLDDLDRFLRRTLGHQTIIGGTVFRTPAGLRLTVRAGPRGNVDLQGTDATLEAMVQKAAEGVFEKTQPYRYSKYLEFTGRPAEAMAVARQLARDDPDPKERAWAWAQIANLLIKVNPRAGVAAGYRAIHEDPTNALAYLNTNILLSNLSHLSEAAALGQKAQELGSRAGGGLSDIGINTSRSNLARLPARTGDFGEALRRIDALKGPTYAGVEEVQASARAGMLLAMHDISGSHAVAGVLPDAWFAAHFADSGGLAAPQYREAMLMEDWPAAVARSHEQLAVLAVNPEGEPLARIGRERHALPRLAVALALNGQLAEARQLAASLPRDCANCAAARATVAGIGGDLAGAKAWTKEAERWGIVPAFSATELGKLYFKSHHYPEALAEAERALAAGPRYADALKLEGDALRKMGRLDEAVDAYAQAEKQAPRWGRLQIDEGVAAARLGKGGEARARFAKAQSLDLSVGDKIVARRLSAMVSRQ